MQLTFILLYTYCPYILHYYIILLQNNNSNDIKRKTYCYKQFQMKNYYILHSKNSEYVKDLDTNGIHIIILKIQQLRKMLKILKLKG